MKNIYYLALFYSPDKIVNRDTEFQNVKETRKVVDYMERIEKVLLHEMNL